MATSKPSFNTQPPEGGWGDSMSGTIESDVSTHSRLKAAGYLSTYCTITAVVSTHSRLKAAGIKGCVKC